MSGVQTHTMHDIMIHRRTVIHKDQHMATAVWREEVPGVTVCDSHGAQLEVALHLRNSLVILDSGAR